MEATIGIFIALGLAAACGFRVFVPPLLAGIAHAIGWLDLSSSMEWIGSPAAIICFAVATVLEITASLIPAVNHALDVVAAPASIVAGFVVSAGAIVDLPPFMHWTLAAILAATVSGSIHVAAASGRAATSATTAGTGSPIFSFLETVLSVITAALAVLAPIVAAVVAVLLLVAAGWVIVKARRLLRRLRGAPPPAVPG